MVLSFAVICNQFVADARSLTISTDFFLAPWEIYNENTL